MLEADPKQATSDASRSKVVRSGASSEGEPETAVRQIGRVIRGKEEVIRLTMIGYLARGHVLLEDVPGLGKTTLARALARVIGGTFRRIQLTSDLLPADIIGVTAVDRETGKLSFRPGPIFANVVLADELNRATPRTQSGLLEAMAERSVSADGLSHPLPDPFFVVATQNPIEHHGVYALPQSQMDRFLLRTGVGYPDEATEKALLLGGKAEDVEDIETVLDARSHQALFEAVEKVHVGEDVVDYLQAIVRTTRETPSLETGVSTRGALAFLRAARARAVIHGRAFVIPDDIFFLAVPVLAHRVVLRGNSRAGRAESEAILRDILEQIAMPV